MTLHATRDGQAITVHGNTGIEIWVEHSQVMHVKITENAQHVRYFWSQLGDLIAQADKERAEVESG